MWISPVVLLVLFFVPLTNPLFIYSLALAGLQVSSRQSHSNIALQEVPSVPLRLITGSVTSHYSKLQSDTIITHISTQPK